jgi:hypothetical protein
VEVIALPREAMAAALADYLQRWPALMLPLGLNPRDPGRFMDFAFEAALVVCAWDLDDGAFRSSAFYPADLVDHYRTRVRSTRDAGLQTGAAGPAPGAGLPSAKRRIDIAGAGLEGLPLWVAQVVRGDEAAIALAANAANCEGALASLLGGLAMAGYAVQADIKDDVEVESQLAALLAEAGLAGFVPPAQPAAGPARCSKLLTAAERWVAERGQVLAEVDLGDDAWHAVLVPQDSVQPWLALGRALGMQLRTGDAAFRG